MNKKKKLAVIIPVCAAVIAAAAAAIAFRPQTVSGSVVDSETNAPMSGVAVTDGRSVVETDENGLFSFKAWRKSSFITVTTPSGYTTDDFYISFEGSAKSYDFKLSKSEAAADSEHTFIQISDTEIGASGAGEWLEELKKLVDETKPAFLIHTGDICYEDGLKKHIEQMNTQTMGCTVRYVIGNHDYVKGSYGEELYESLYGPVWYSFDVGKTHYVVTSFQDGSDYKSRYNKNDRWRWLENDLKCVDEDMKVVIFNHNRPYSQDYVLEFDGKELDLKQHGLIAWIFGHYHYNYVSESDGVKQISTARPDCGGIDSSAAGARIIRVGASGELETELRYLDYSGTSEPENSVWTKELDSNVLYCDTLLDSGRLYTATVCDDFPVECSIYCLDSATGEEIWRYKTLNSVKNNLVIGKDRLFAMDAQGGVYCLNKENGDEIWKVNINLGNSLGTSSGIALSGNTLCAGTSRVITALNAETGEVLWENERDKGENSPAEFVIRSDTVLVSSHWDSLAAISLGNGSSLWSVDDEDIRFRSSTPVFLDDKRILVADDDAIAVIDATNGDIISKLNSDDIMFSSSGQPAFDGKTVYIPTSDSGIAAYSVDENKIIWQYKTGESILFTAPYVGKGKATVESSPLLDSGCVIFGANDGYVYSLNAQDGTLIKKYKVGSAVLGKVAVTDEKIFACGFDGVAVCFDR